MLGTTLRVQVGGQIREYPADVAGFGDHLANGGQVVSLHTAQGQAREFFRANRDETWQALTFWATLDESGLAYQVEINRRGTHAVQAAAPLPGPGNVQELYVA